jgi:hypothetical protein
MIPTKTAFFERFAGCCKWVNSEINFNAVLLFVYFFSCDCVCHGVFLLLDFSVVVVYSFCKEAEVPPLPQSSTEVKKEKQNQEKNHDDDYDGSW